MSRAINVRGSDAEVFETSNVGSWPLSTRMHVPDGRVFRYAKNGSVALTVGKLVASPARELRHANLSVAATRAAGDNFLTATISDVLVGTDDYKDGLVYVNDGSKQGHVYRISRNTQTPVSGTIEVFLQVNLQTPLGTSDQVTLIKNVYNGVALSKALLTQRVVGVPPIDVAASRYFWAQTFGPMAILQDGTLYEFRDVMPSVFVHGAISNATVPIAANANDEIQAAENISVIVNDAENNERLAEIPVLKGLQATNIVGYSLDPRSDTEYSLVQLTIID